MSLLFLLSCRAAGAKGPVRTVEGTVTRVLDGDTVQLTDRLGARLKISLYGIDAPETEKRSRKSGAVAKEGQPHGEEALRALRGKVEGRRVSAEVMDWTATGGRSPCCGSQVVT